VGERVGVGAGEASVEELTGRLSALLREWIGHVAQAELEAMDRSDTEPRELTVTFDLRDFPERLRFEIRAGAPRES